MPHRFGRPDTGSRVLTSFLDEAGRLHSFVPPFRFTSFFSPEDTLLCTCAAEAALVHARSQKRMSAWSRNTMRIVELTTGSGLVGLHLLLMENGTRLTGLDVDPTATAIAERNAKLLGLSKRTRFECADLWSDSTLQTLREAAPDLMICNPPYVPEPEEEKLKIEAGAGRDGTAHLMRTIELAADLQPKALGLSWCSLSDPAKVLRAAGAAGYSLKSLFTVVIADGEYSGSVHDYLRSLPHAYINEQPETVNAVASDGSGRFAFLLMAGDFCRRDPASDDSASAVENICRSFVSEGLTSLVNPVAPVPVRSWILDRWDELRLRAFLHGASESTGVLA